MSKLIDGSLPAVTLVAGLSAEEVDREARKACRYTEVGHRALAFYLAEMKRRGLHQALGHPSVVCYATRELGMSRRTARELVQVGEALGELEAIDRAFGDGELTWSKLRSICRKATPETEAEWLQVAKTHSREELGRMVRVAEDGEGPPKGGGLPCSRFRLQLDLDARQYQVWENLGPKGRGRCDLGRSPRVRQQRQCRQLIDVAPRSRRRRVGGFARPQIGSRHLWIR